MTIHIMAQGTQFVLLKNKLIHMLDLGAHLLLGLLLITNDLVLLLGACIEIKCEKGTTKKPNTGNHNHNIVVCII